MDIRSGLIRSIGNTPLIELKTLSDRSSFTILGKAELLNPGGSVKDRAACHMIEDAEARGRLAPGCLCQSTKPACSGARLGSRRRIVNAGDTP